MINRGFSPKPALTKRKGNDALNEVAESVLILIAGIGVFMFGMKFMSDGLERSAGGGMRKLLGKISSNRFAGVGVGAVVSAVIHSSAATTVMVIGFVNAGLMTLTQATAIIMGANIGTTITGIMVSLSAFSLNAIFGVLAFFGAMMVMFLKKEKYKRLGYILGGLGMIFVGLDVMGGAFGNEKIAAALADVFTHIDFPLLLILVGMVFTAVVQSSTAVTGIIVTMVGAGALPLECALFIVLGTNIGTCVTAAFASVGANANAKRTAVIHLAFNVIGTIIFTAIIWPLSDKIVYALQAAFPQPQFQVAMFHVIFNVLTTAVLLPFIKPLTKFATAVVREKPSEKDDEPHMYYVDERFLQTPQIAVAQVKHEVDHMGVMAKENLRRSMNAVLKLDLSEASAVEKDELCINYINKGMTNYLIKLSSQSLSRKDEKFVGSLFHVVTDIERIADYAKNFMDDAREMIDCGNRFTDDALIELEDMYDKVMAMFDEAMFIFENNEVGKLPDFSAREDEVDMTKRVLGINHIKRLNSGGCSVETGTHFYSIITSLERIADHLTNIAFSIKSPTGSQREAMEKIAAEQRKKVNNAKAAHANASASVQPEVAATEEKTDVAAPSDADETRSSDDVGTEKAL